MNCPECHTIMKETKQVHKDHMDTFMECPHCKNRIPKECACIGMANAIMGRKSKKEEKRENDED